MEMRGDATEYFIKLAFAVRTVIAIQAGIFALADHLVVWLLDACLSVLPQDQCFAIIIRAPANIDIVSFLLNHGVDTQAKPMAKHPTQNACPGRPASARAKPQKVRTVSVFAYAD